MQDGSNAWSMTLYISAAWMEWHSPGIIAKTFPRGEYVVESRSQGFKHGTGWKVFTAFFFFLNSPKHCQWLVPSSIYQVPLSLAKWLRENAATDPIPCTNIQGSQIISSSKLWHTSEFSEKLHRLRYWNWLWIGHTLSLRTSQFNTENLPMRSHFPWPCTGIPFEINYQSVD